MHFVLTLFQRPPLIGPNEHNPSQPADYRECGLSCKNPDDSRLTNYLFVSASALWVNKNRVSLDVNPAAQEERK
jgi:hypothetical protein